MSDQRVSLRRSSQGKSNSTASICVVSSIETWSTQSNTSFLGRLSRHSAERLRMLIASWSRWVGVNIGATVLRCALWRGWSMAMKLSRRRSVGDVADGDAAERRRRREHRMIGLDVHDVVVFGDRPIRPEHAVLAVMHGIFRRSRSKYGQNVSERNRSGSPGSNCSSGIASARARVLLLWILNEIDGPVHRSPP
jgi:hypothetical protein